MRFMLIMLPAVYRRPVSHDFLPDPQAVARMSRFNEDMRKAGVLLALDGLTPPGAGARVCFSGGQAKVRQGSCDGGQEAVGGYWLIRVASRAEAVAWARRCPAAESDVIEVRRVHEAQDFRSADAAGQMR